MLKKRKSKRQEALRPSGISTSKGFYDGLGSFRASLEDSVKFGEHLDRERQYLIQRAPNAIEWITGPSFCNQPSLFQHWGAYQLVKEFFELRCPHCNDGFPEDSWGLSRETMESEVLLRHNPKYDDMQCPRCGVTQSELIDNGVCRGFHYGIGIIGQRSGKSSTAALMASYMEHVALTIAHGYDGGLSSYFGVPRGELLHATCVASTDTQSKETIWAKYIGYRANSPWFQRYVPWVKSQEKVQATPEGMKLLEYRESDKSIKNELIGLSIDSLNSNSNGLAGRTRLWAMIDEICRMEQTESSKSAQEVYRTMDASCQTIQSRTDQYGLLPWMGTVFAISSPIAEDDMGMRLLQSPDPRTYKVHKATWEFNPWEPYEAYVEKLKRDYVGTMRNFGARPPGTASPFIDRPSDFVKSAVDMKLKPTATFDTYEMSDDLGRSYLAVRLAGMPLLRDGYARYIAVDAGKNFDAFSVACAHGEEQPDGTVITVYDWVIRLLTTRKNQEVYFEGVYQLMEELTKRMHIARVEFDHWNSTHIIQRLRTNLQLRAEEAVTTAEHFIKFLRDSYSDRMRLLPPLPDDDALDPPYKSAQGAALWEILHLERDPKNDKVFNSKKGRTKGWNSDDTARVIVHAHRLVQDRGYTVDQDDTSRRARAKRAEHARAEWLSQGGGGIVKPMMGSSAFRGSGGRGW